ncbi:hypothetical protein G8Y83_09730 [Staphylococcus sp. 10602379]|nr:hypothetical protein [Staphylococcus sp. 10602379]
MWWIILFVIYTLLLLGFARENAHLMGKLEAREYEKRVLESRLKHFEGESEWR